MQVSAKVCVARGTAGLVEVAIADRRPFSARKTCSSIGRVARMTHFGYC